MWALDNRTPFAAERTWARDRDGAEIWVVAVRATFALGDQGEVVLAEEQQKVCLAPVHMGQPGVSSLRYDMDLVRRKTGTDIVLHATAHAPGASPAESVDVHWRVGAVEKRLRVVGDRTWRAAVFGLSPSRPQRFTTMPIRYERALGGLLHERDDAPRDPFNPAGVGRLAVEGTPVPNCEYPNQPVRSPTSRAAVAGFGPIPCEWQPRTRLAGTYDDAWRKNRQPLVPLDFSDEYFRCAPLDQRAECFLRGGEEVVLRNLTPSGEYRFTLPRITLGFTTFINTGRTHHPGQLHTVIIEPDEKRLIMVWQTALPCHHTVYTLKETIVFEKERLAPGLKEPAMAALT